MCLKISEINITDDEMEIIRSHYERDGEILQDKIKYIVDKDTKININLNKRQENNVKTFICSANMMHHDVLFCATIGNDLPENDKNYNPCLKLHCDSTQIADLLYCRKFKISVDKKDLKPSLEKGFAIVNINDCEVELL